MNEKADFGSLADYEKGVGAGDSEYFKFREGSNPLRLLSNGSVVQSVQQGQSYAGTYYAGKVLDDDQSINTKWMFWVLDRTDGQLKLARFGYKLVKQLEALQKKADYAFDSFPMPYDIDIIATNAGKKEVVYTIFPARSNSDLTEEELATYSKKTPVKDIADRMREKQMKKDGVVSEKIPETEQPGEIPF